MAARLIYRGSSIVCLLALFLLAESARAQGVATTSTTTTTVTTQQIAGVMVDADGVLRMHKHADPGGRLSRRRVEEAYERLSTDVSRESDLRKISLNRLEAAVQASLDRGEEPTEVMLFLAGLNRVKYVFFYPETNDVVIAGPAGAWAKDLSGRIRNVRNGRPVVELQDLIVALRSHPPTERGSSVISCSIDPTKEGLANMQEFLRRVGGRATPNQTRFIANGLRKSLGLQKISLTGIPADTHYAQVLVEADYRMKLIGIGLERTSVDKLKAYVDLAKPAAVAKNAMQRWYFVPNYECVRVDEDELAMELVGLGVKLIGADELVSADGTRLASGRSDAAGKKFVDGFTARYEEIASKVPVYAQLRNCIDLAVAAAFIQEQDYYGRSGWMMDFFGDESLYPVRTVHAPERVESAVASIWKGRRLMTPIGGGVNIQARLALTPENLLGDEQGAVKARRDSISLDHLDDGQWWWD